MRRCTCEFRFYEELNDYLPAATAEADRSAREIAGTPSVKDAIESLGVPHTEIDLILVDGRSVRFDRRLRGGERVAVYPEFERFDISPLSSAEAEAAARIRASSPTFTWARSRVTCGYSGSTRSTATTSTTTSSRELTVA